MKEIDPEDYWQKLLDLVEKKSEFVKEPDPFKKKYKIQQYLIGRGFESDLVQSAVETVFSGQNL